MDYKMNPFIIFDNGGKTLDRFTIINKETGDVFGCGEKPDEPGGTGKYCGNCADLRIVMTGAGWRQKMPSRKVIKEEADNYINNARLDPNWIGTEVDFHNFSVNLQQYIFRLGSHNRIGQSSTLNVVYLAGVSEKSYSESGTR